MNGLEEFMQILDSKKYKKKVNKFIYPRDILKFIWKGSIYPFTLFFGVGYWYMLYKRNLVRKYKYICYELDNVNERVKFLSIRKKKTFNPEQENRDKLLLKIKHFKKILLN